MLRHEDIIDLVDALPVRSYKTATSQEPLKLNKHQADALGTGSRNIIRVVKAAIQAIADKLFIERISAADTTVQEAIEEWYADTRMDVIQRDLYKLVVRDGIAYVQAKYENNTPTVAIIESYDGRTGAVSGYDPQTKKELFVVNVWYAGSTRNIDIYYPERIEKYTYDTDDSRWKPRTDYEGEQWPIDWTDTAGNPLGIALVRFDINESDIVEAVQLQRDINDALVDLLATSRTMGWPQRVLKNASQETYLLNQYAQPLVTTDAFGTSYPIPRKIELTPGSILMLQGTESDLSQLAPATADTAVLDTLLALLSDTTTVPRYVFTGGEWPSGVALLNAEMRLNHKVESHQGHLTPAYEALFNLMLRISNTFGSTSFDVDALVTVVWASPQVYTEDLKMEMEQNRVDNAVKLRTAGILSNEDALRYMFSDKSEEEIQQMVARTNAESALPNL